MDLSQAVTIELPGQAALDLNSVRDPNAVGSAPVSGYNIESVDFSDVGVTAFSEDTPQVDGIDSYDAYLGARQIAMIIGVYGNSYGDFWDKITELNYALQPRPTFATGQAFPDDGFRKLSFTQLKAAGSYSLYMKVRPMALPRFVTEAGASLGMQTVDTPCAYGSCSWQKTHTSTSQHQGCSPLLGPELCPSSTMGKRLHGQLLLGATPLPSARYELSLAQTA